MTSITMPQMGETITEGTVAKWLKKEGDRVEKDEPIVEISTDKVDTEVPSPVGGIVKRIAVREGETVPVETELASIEEAVTAGAEAPRTAERAPTPPGFISPVVRRLAAEKGVDLTGVAGTGAGGRISKKDVLSAAAARAARPEAPPPPPRRPAEAPRPGYREETVPLSYVRRAIAENMLKSSQGTAHVTAVVEVDMENVARQRSSFKQAFKEREGISLTYLPFVARAAVLALQRFPRFNAEFEGDRLIVKYYVNLAVSVDRPDGLVAPVIRNADALNIPGLARAIHDVASKARSGRLTHEETRGGTFTITNPGSIGTLWQTPIINPPQVAIVSLEKIEKRVVPLKDGIGIRRMAYLPLTYDHRVVDGADAARFLIAIKERLEEADFTADLREYGPPDERAAA
ncbi:MAG: dihydrolipoamide acetyltransferase family protein [Candidatus Aquicultorales bacterium]